MSRGKVDCSASQDNLDSGPAYNDKQAYRDVSTLVIRVDGEVEPHELDKLLVLSETEQGAQVLGVVGRLVNGRKLVASVGVSVDSTGNVGKLGNEVHGVLEGRSPVELLVETVLVGLGKRRVVVELEGGKGTVCDDAAIKVSQVIGVGVCEKHVLGMGRRERRTAVTASENWDMGWRVEGHESIKSSTNLGIAAREAQSAERAVTCSWVGTSPVRRSQKRASGRGSEPPGALGRSSWHSGMVLPRNRIPSSGKCERGQREVVDTRSWQRPRETKQNMRGQRTAMDLQALGRLNLHQTHVYIPASRTDPTRRNEARAEHKHDWIRFRREMHQDDLSIAGCSLTLPDHSLVK